MATHSVTQNDDDDAEAATHPLSLFEGGDVEGGRVSVCELYAKKSTESKLLLLSVASWGVLVRK